MIPYENAKKRYELLGKAIESLEVELLKAEITNQAAKDRMTQDELSGKAPSQQLLMGYSMSAAEMVALPAMIAIGKQKRFQAYEEMKKLEPKP